MKNYIGVGKNHSEVENHSKVENHSGVGKNHSELENHSGVGRVTAVNDDASTSSQGAIQADQSKLLAIFKRLHCVYYMLYVLQNGSG